MRQFLMPQLLKSLLERNRVLILPNAFNLLLRHFKHLSYLGHDFLICFKCTSLSADTASASSSNYITKLRQNPVLKY